jgi:hypothetical protein
VIGLLGFVLLLVFLYTSRRNGSQASEKIGTHPGQSDASHIDPVIDLSRLIPTTKRVAGMFGHVSAANRLEPSIILDFQVFGGTTCLIIYTSAKAHI